MEVCQSKSASNESDMGIFDADAILIVPGTGRNSHTTMEGGENIGIRDAKVRAPAPGWRYLTAVTIEAADY